MISEIIKLCRTKKGYSQQKLGNLLGVTQQAIGKWEKGLAEPDQKAINSLCSIFNISSDYLLGRTDIRNNITSPAKFDDNTVVAIGRGGKRVVYNISDEDADFIDAFLSKFDKKNT